jgi:hypothetical protein
MSQSGQGASTKAPKVFMSQSGQGASTKAQNCF